MLMPVPVVVDADMLIRNVEYTIRKGWAGALLGRASGGYSLSTGVVLFAAAPAHVRRIQGSAQARAWIAVRSSSSNA